MILSKLSHKQLIDPIIEATLLAMNAICQHYTKPVVTMEKSDGSPLTQADLASHELLCTELEKLTPDIPIISEESNLIYQPTKSIDYFWLVDPLDGTKEFINQNGEFTTNVALIYKNQPVLGVVGCPALNCIYIGSTELGAYKLSLNGHQKKKAAIKIRQPNKEGIIVVGSRSHSSPEALSEFLPSAQEIKAILPTGSSLKFCRLAEGKAHLYPRLGRTMEWDTAAGHAILNAAGGEVLRVDNKTPLTYGKPSLENPHFIAKTYVDNFASHI